MARTKTVSTTLRSALVVLVASPAAEQHSHQRRERMQPEWLDGTRARRVAAILPWRLAAGCLRQTCNRNYGICHLNSTSLRHLDRWTMHALAWLYWASGTGEIYLAVAMFWRLHNYFMFIPIIVYIGRYGLWLSWVALLLILIALCNLLSIAHTRMSQLFDSA